RTQSARLEITAGLTRQAVGFRPCLGRAFSPRDRRWARRRARRHGTRHPRSRGATALDKEQSNALVALLIQHVGYLHLYGHALTMAQHVFRQACLKVDAATAPLFFAEVLNNGGSIQYGLGSAVEEAR